MQAKRNTDISRCFSAHIVFDITPQMDDVDSFAAVAKKQLRKIDQSVELLVLSVEGKTQLLFFVTNVGLLDDSDQRLRLVAQKLMYPGTTEFGQETAISNQEKKRIALLRKKLVSRQKGKLPVVHEVKGIGQQRLIGQAEKPRSHERGVESVDPVLHSIDMIDFTRLTMTLKYAGRKVPAEIVLGNTSKQDFLVEFSKLLTVKELAMKTWTNEDGRVTVDASAVVEAIRYAATSTERR